MCFYNWKQLHLKIASMFCHEVEQKRKVRKKFWCNLFLLQRQFFRKVLPQKYDRKTQIPALLTCTQSHQAPCHSTTNMDCLKEIMLAGVPKQGGKGGYIHPNNFDVSPPIVWEWSTTSASPAIIWMGVHLSVNLGKKCSILVKDLFFWSSPEFEEKSVPFAFVLVFTKFPHLNKIVVEIHPPQCSNWAKLG